jgi:hypothetical protein
LAQLEQEAETARRLTIELGLPTQEEIQENYHESLLRSAGKGKARAVDMASSGTVDEDMEDREVVEYERIFIESPASDSTLEIPE